MPLHTLRRLARPFAAFGALLLLLTSLPSALLAAEATKNFDVPAGDAGTTIKQFAKQADREIIFPAEPMDGIRTNAVKGAYAPLSALGKMLDGTSFVAIEDPSGALAVKRGSDPKAQGVALTAAGDHPGSNDATAGHGGIMGRIRDVNNYSYLSNATVAIPELGRATTTQKGGDFSLGNLPAGTHTIVISFTGYSDVTKTIVVPSGGVTHLDVDIGDEITRMGQFVVTGEREGQAKALQEKRTSDAIMDVVSADSAGKLPDGNAAEAVRRLPGVFAKMDQGEGRFIVIRGVDPTLNNVTMNGLSIGSPGAGDRSTQMDAVPSDLISRVEVVKAVTPDMDAQAIGGTVNIVSPSAFDQSESFVRGTAAGGYFNGPSTDRGNKTPIQGSISAGTQFGGGKWGIVVGASFNYRHYISNRRSGGGTWFPSAATGPGANFFLPSEESKYYYDVQRWREGLNVNLEYRPNDSSQYFFRTTLNHFKDDEGRDLVDFEFYRTAFPATFDIASGSATFTGGRSSDQYRHYVQKHRINNYSFGGKNKLFDGSKTLDYTFSSGSTGIDVPERTDLQFRSAANMTSTLVLNGGTMWKVIPDAPYFNLANYPLRSATIRSDNEYEDIYNAIVNFKSEQTLFGKPLTWQVGGKYLWHLKGWVRQNIDYFPVGTWNLGSYNFTNAPRTIYGGYFAMLPAIDYFRTWSIFNAHPELISLSPLNSVADSTANYFRITEGIGAGYAMAKLNLAPNFSILAGLRDEETEVKGKAIQNPTVNGAFIGPQPYNFARNYSNFMPGVHLNYQPAKNLVLRAAWTNTLGRPSYSSYGVTRSYSYSQDVGATTYSGSITDGNANLQPYQSSNFDVSAEYYFQHTGILSIGAFRKDIKNPIYTYSYTLRNSVFDGKTFSTLSYQQPLNGNSGKVNGVEFNYQLQLTMLPSPFNGLGFSANYTIVTSSETLPTRLGENLPFASQAPKIYNAALFYEKGPVEARIAYTYTGAYILGFGSDVNSDDYQSDRHQVDAKISYRITRNLTIYVEGLNLTQQRLDEYAGYDDRNSAIERYWWTANAGVNFKF